MFSLSERHRYFLYSQSTDMRKGFDALSGLVRNEMALDPVSGDVYIFLNRPRNRMKLLVWEGDGFLLYYKRLEQGTYERITANVSNESSELSWQNLMLLLKGIELKSIKRRKRFSFKKTG